MKYWACLHSADDASQLQQGADALLYLSMGPTARREDVAGNTSGVPRLVDQSEGDMEVDDYPEDADDLGA
jgi:hypothetical protein